MSFQHDFNVAIASWVSSGIHQKMEKDITTSKAFRGHFDDAFWVPQQLLTNKSLTMGHATPAFIILGLGLMPALISFLIELLHHQYKGKTASNMRTGMTPSWMP